MLYKLEAVAVGLCAVFLPRKVHRKTQSSRSITMKTYNFNFWFSFASQLSFVSQLSSNISLKSMSNLVKFKDSQWLQLDVCREFQRGSCPRTDSTCKYAHPPQHVEVSNGKVMACYDSCKGRCLREICKFYHPSAYLVDTVMSIQRLIFIIFCKNRISFAASGERTQPLGSEKLSDSSNSLNSTFVHSDPKRHVGNGFPRNSN